MKTILITTDYSRAGNNALEYAAALAKGMDAKLVIFNAFNLATPTSSAPYLPNIFELIEENTNRITAMGQKISESYGIEVECAVSRENVLEGLRRQMRKHHADLVVMGMNGESLVSRTFGGTTTAVIREGRYPVLVVPLEASFSGLFRILFAANYKYLRKNNWLSLVKELASIYMAQVQILHVEQADNTEENVHKQATSKVPNLEEIFSGVKHTYRFLFHENIREGIQRGIDEFHADLLVMIPHKTNFWQALIHPSTTKRMAFNSQIPILALPEVKVPVRKKTNNHVKETI